MSRWTPCKRTDFVRRMRKMGFEGPFSGTRHQFMVLLHHRPAIPSNEEYSILQLRMLLREVAEILGHEISLEEWS